MTSRYIRKEFQEELKVLLETLFWDPKLYDLNSGGATIEKIKKYIKNQGH